MLLTMPGWISPFGIQDKSIVAKIQRSYKVFSAAGRINEEKVTFTWLIFSRKKHSAALFWVWGYPELQDEGTLHAVTLVSVAPSLSCVLDSPFTELLKHDPQARTWESEFWHLLLKLSFGFLFFKKKIFSSDDCDT